MDIDKRLDTNNFLGYFPGSFYRPENLDDSSALKLSICQDLDNLVGDRFDWGPIRDQLGLRINLTMKAIKLYGMGCEITDIVGEYSYESTREYFRMVYPIYCEMRALGYSYDELTI